MAKLEHKPVIDWDCDIQTISGTKWVSKDEAEAAIKKAVDNEGNGWMVAFVAFVALIWAVLYIITH